jgi:hypothetical protein
LREVSFNSEKWCGAHASASEAYIKKDNRRLPDRQRRSGRLTIVANEGARPGLFESRTICFSPFNLQSDFVSRFSLSIVIQIWCYLFLIFSKIKIYSFMTFFSYVIPFLGCYLYTLYCSLLVQHINNIFLHNHY